MKGVCVFVGVCVGFCLVFLLGLCWVFVGFVLFFLWVLLGLRCDYSSDIDFPNHEEGPLAGPDRKMEMAKQTMK